MRTAYVKKAGLGLNTSQTKHEANDHGTVREDVKGKRAMNILFR